MRKDVKLGMAIGGGLIAVLVGYLLFAPPTNNNKKGTQLTLNSGVAGSSNIIDPPAPGELTGAEDKPGTTAGKSTGSSDVSGQVTPGNTADTATAGKPSSEGSAAKAKNEASTAKAKNDDKAEAKASKAAGKPSGAPVSSKEAAREAAGNGNKPEKHVTVAEGSGSPAGGETRMFYNPNDAWGGGVSTDAVFGNNAAAKSAKAVGAGSPERSGTAGERAGEARDRTATDGAGVVLEEPGTHVVRAGETLSSIALAAYGSSSYYPHILRANPGVNANHLKLGAVLKMPKADEVRVTGAAGASGASAASPTGDAVNGDPSVKEEPKIDSTKQYRVGAGDSLYKIAMKVYGKSSYVDKLYERNKVAIGSNPTRLKLGMVLELPEKGATASAAPAGDPATSKLESGPVVDDSQPK